MSNNKKPKLPFYFGEDEENTPVSSPEEGVSMKPVPLYKEDGTSLIHYARRRAEQGEDGRWRLLIEEVRTYNAAIWTADNIEGRIMEEWPTEAAYTAWKKAMKLPIYSDNN